MGDAALSEIQSFSAKRTSLRDKLKKRREALGSILSQASSSPATAATLSASSSTVADSQVPAAATAAASLNPTQPSGAPKKSPSLAAAALAERTSGAADLSDAAPSSKRACIARSQSGGGVTSSGAGGSAGGVKDGGDDDLMSLLSAPSAKEKADQQKREEILELLGKPTAKERSLIDSFKSSGSGGVQQFCTHSTKAECVKVSGKKDPCSRLHFAKILQPHTDESLGDCSFLNTCFHMDSCKYIHYQVDPDDIKKASSAESGCGGGGGGGNNGSGGVASGDSRGDGVGGGHAGSHDRHAGHKLQVETRIIEGTKLTPPQWVQCDLRNFKLPVLGKFTVVMADPPWDIHMELPYGTMSDEEMRRLPVPTMQDEGLIFLWVTGRAMELGRECLKLWGYERVDEIIWVKTNQLQRIIRTGRTGHWLNHGKEHCLVGMKGNCPKFNRGMDSDVIVAEVRATSHKPDEIYGIIERLSPGTRKIELFGRPHNVQPNWVTLGNQLDGVLIHDRDMLDRWNDAYPDGYNITEDIFLHPRQKP